MPSVAVTGGSGFIGSHVVDLLRGDGIRVRSIDIRRPDRELIDDDVVADLLDAAQTQRALEGIEFVLHLAGPVLGDVKRDPYGSSLLQLAGTLHVLEAARRQKVKKVVLASSFYVYSGLDPEAVANEQTVLDVTKMDLFGSTKAEAERLVRAYGASFGLAWTILRFGSVYGFGRYTNVVQDIVLSGLKGEPFLIWGRGYRRNQYTYVEDVASAVARSVDPVADDKVYNVVSSEVTTVRELADLMSAQGFQIQFDVERPDPPSMCYMTSHLIERELGWRPRPLVDGLAQVIGQAQYAEGVGLRPRVE